MNLVRNIHRWRPADRRGYAARGGLQSGGGGRRSDDERLGRAAELTEAAARAHDPAVAE